MRCEQIASKGEGRMTRCKGLTFSMIVMHADHMIYRHPGPVFLSGLFLLTLPLQWSALNSSLACTFLSCDYIVAHNLRFCNMRSAQSLQQNFVESAESCDKCCFSCKNLFTSKKRCDIMKMLWCLARLPYTGSLQSVEKRLSRRSEDGRFGI